MISASFLSIKDNMKENILRLDHTDITYLHLDIMDGEFVSNKTWDITEIKELLNGTKKPLDVHLMVHDIDKYLNDYQSLKPEYITFHYEATENPHEVIQKIKRMGCKAGISLKPNTDVTVLNPFLDELDLILVMSVEPGLGGQEFIPSSVYKIDYLNDQRGKCHYHYVISVDGGINENTIRLVKNADVVVIGSAITKNSDYAQAVGKLKNIETSMS